MKIGIVGSEAAKFTKETEGEAKALIRGLLTKTDIVVSGQCHLGGVDIFAVEIGRELGCTIVEFPPKILQWEGGYKQRNLSIARYSDTVYCITVKEYPPNYSGMRFKYCYHCKTSEHVKSGGCWTVKQAKKMGKPGEVLCTA